MGRDRPPHHGRGGGPLSVPDLDELRPRTHVLVADTDPSFLSQAKDRLSRLCYTVAVAGDRQALEETLETAGAAVDVLVVDVRLLGSDVAGTIARLKKDRPDLDPIVTTGYLHMEQAVRAVESGAFDIITKPPVWARVTRTIDIVVEHRALLSEDVRPERRSGPDTQPSGTSPEAATAAYEFLMGMVPSFGYVDLLASGKLGELSQVQRDAIEVVRQGLEWAKRRIRGYIANSLTDPQSLPVNREQLEIGELVEFAAEMFRPLAYEAGIEITFQQSVPITVSVDRDRLLVILFSLIHNAVENTKAGGEVALAVTETDTTVVVTVHDTGIGIPEKYQSRIFEPFFRVPGPDRPGSEGIGLGLASTRQNAILLEALLEMRSTPGQGSTFALALPKTPVGG